MLPPHAAGAPTLLLVSTPLQPPDALAVANHVVNAALTAAWDWHDATVVFVGQFNTTGIEVVSNSLKLSMAHSSLFPSENTRIFKLIVEPVPIIVFVISLKAFVSCKPPTSPQPSLLVSSYKYLSLVPEALPLLKKRTKLIKGPPSILYCTII